MKGDTVPHPPQPIRTQQAWRIGIGGFLGGLQAILAYRVGSEYGTDLSTSFPYASGAIVVAYTYLAVYLTQQNRGNPSVLRSFLPSILYGLLGGVFFYELLLLSDSGFYSANRSILYFIYSVMAAAVTTGVSLGEHVAQAKAPASQPDVRWWRRRTLWRNLRIVTYVVVLAAWPFAPASKKTFWLLIACSLPIIPFAWLVIRKKWEAKVAQFREKGEVVPFRKSLPIVAGVDSFLYWLVAIWVVSGFCRVFADVGFELGLWTYRVLRFYGWGGYGWFLVIPLNMILFAGICLLASRTSPRARLWQTHVLTLLAVFPLYGIVAPIVALYIPLFESIGH